MAYLDKSGLDALWEKIKNWTNSVHAHSMAKGASSQDGLQLMLKDGSQSPVTLSTVTITKSDITALGIPGSNTTYTPATQSAPGLMSAADKKKLDGVAEGANKYTHPTSAAGAKASGLYKVATDAQGHVTGATAVTKADISPLESDPTVPSWAKAASKPSYNVDEIAVTKTPVGFSTTDGLGDIISGLASKKQDNIADLATIRAGAAKGATAVQTETDPTVPAWAKQPLKPSYDASEIDYDADGEWSVKDILDSKQPKIADLATIRAGAAKGATAIQTETDPTVPAWAKAASKPSYLANEIGMKIIPLGFTEADDVNTVLVGLAKNKAPEDSPEFTGTPKAPTAAAGTNTTQVATTAFVHSEVAAASTGAAKYQGGMTAAAYGKLTTYKAGWYWVVTEAGTIAGEACEVGDMVFCNTDSTGAKAAPESPDNSEKNSHFDIVQNNIEAIPLSVINALS